MPNYRKRCDNLWEKPYHAETLSIFAAIFNALHCNNLRTRAAIMTMTIKTEDFGENSGFIEDCDMSVDDPCFCVDAMLGNIAVRLRILGFNTIYPCTAPIPECFFVTARQRSNFPGTIRIIDRNLKNAVKLIMQEADIRPETFRILSRCLICNCKVQPASPDEVISSVPETIRKCYAAFTKCRKCGRVYWEGPHYARILRELKDWRIL